LPPVAASYQINNGVAAPEFELTDAEGITEPHWLELDAEGADGIGLTVTDTVALLEQVLAIFVAVAV
jgi:hypothetical protein